MQTEQFTRIARKYMDTVYRVALNYMKSPDAADDITQEVLRRLRRSQTEVASEEHVRNWLIRVTINECKRDFTARWRKAEPLEAYAEKLSFTSTETGDVYRSVMSLPRKYRLVIYLHYYEGYSTAEIAQLLRSKPSTVCTQLERGRKLLKNMLLEADNV